MRRIALFLLLVALAAPTAAPVAAQDPAPATAEADVGSSTITAADPERSGLPPVAPPPRTLRAYWHLFGAYTIIWILLFGYVVSLGRRSARLEEQIRRLESSGA